MTPDELVYKAMLHVQGCKYIYEDHLEGLLLHAAHGQHVSDADLAIAKTRLREKLKAIWVSKGPGL